MRSQIDEAFGRTPEEISEGADYRDKIPVNLNYILTGIGMPAVSMDFSTLETKLGHCHILGIVSSDRLAQEFGISVDVMEKRLEHIKVSYYNKEGKAVIYGQDDCPRN